MKNNKLLSIHSNSPIFSARLANSVAINKEILTAYNQLGIEDWLKRSHYFGGRYENLYLEREKIPSLTTIIKQAELFAQQILNTQQNLRSGFWFNEMGPNQATTEHDHDEDDELLSGVYYVEVPENSGDLVILDKKIPSRTIVKPQEGMFVFFAPSVLHEVTVNLSNQRRISIGMNFGPAPKN
ncbi:MAG: 2OG-Fe(II) oxygenase [Gallionellaceae bacterium]